MVSSEVRKLFMKISGSGASCVRRRCSTWRAITSRNDQPLRTQSRDFARSMPIDVPRPPLSLMTAVAPQRRGRGLVVDLDVGERLHVERLDGRLGDHARSRRARAGGSSGRRCRWRRGRCPAVGHLRPGTVESGAAHDFDRRLAGCPHRNPDRAADPPPRPLWPRSRSATGSAPRATVARSSRWSRPGRVWPRCVTARPEVRRAATVAAYVSIGSEPGTGALLDALTGAGQARDPARRCSPTWTSTGAPGAARPRWRRRGWACSSRSTGSGVDAVATADVVLVPGARGLDSRRPARPGRRVLRPGAGPGARRHARRGLLYDDEVGLDVPVDEHDRPVTAAATPTRWIPSAEVRPLTD